MFEMFEEEAAWKDCQAEMFCHKSGGTCERLADHQGIPSPAEYNDILESKIHRNNNPAAKV